METALQPLERFKVGQPAMIKGELSKNHDHIKHRLFVTVSKIGKARVTLVDSSGRKYCRTPGKIAVFIQPPANWNELFQQGELINYSTPIIG